MKFVLQLYKAQPVGVIISIIYVLLALLGPLVSGQDPNRIDMRYKLAPPSGTHLMGTDHLGRDVASRLLHAARTSLYVVLLAAAFCASIGVPLGLVSGFLGGGTDVVLSRVTDAMLTLPTVIVAFVMAVLLGPSLLSASLAIGMSGVPRMLRVARAAALEVKAEAFVEASRATGASTPYILSRVVLPNALAPLIIQLTYFAPLAIMWESGLSFLGIGVQPPDPSWGVMLSTAKKYLWSSPTFLVFPALAVVLSMTGLNLLGDGLRSALDPLTLTRRAKKASREPG